jgi:AcrR family transcriptional regulator
MNVKSSLEVDQPRPGLRERKKAKTRAAIQDHALRLFREQGYAETTVEQIAEAAEVSPSTFFRYFPTKEEVVLYDAFDPLLIEAFRAQPPELTPIQAMRGAMRIVFGDVPAEQMAQQRERSTLMFSVPELRAAALDQLLETGQMLMALVSERVDRPIDDFAVRTFAGAIAGAMIAAIMPAIQDPDADFLALGEAALDYLEAGLPL